jgi:hypothetical protein
VGCTTVNRWAHPHSLRLSLGVLAAVSVRLNLGADLAVFKFRRLFPASKIGDEVHGKQSAVGPIWTADGTRLPGYRLEHGYQGASFITGKICAEGCAFEVRFGTRNGERRAYLTADYGHDNPGTLVDVEVSGGALVVTRTSLFASFVSRGNIKCAINNLHQPLVCDGLQYG